MTSEQRQYLKGAIDAHRRAALAADGDVKFRQRPVTSDPNQPMLVLATTAGMYGIVSLFIAIALLAV
jgi:hypothetical protein